MKLFYFFHKFPHLNITFQRVNSTFDLNNQVYLESLGILASFPALVLIFILFILLLYLLTRCCDRQGKRRSFVCLKILLGFLGLLCCGAIGIGLYGNDDFHTGIEILVQNLTKIRGRFAFLYSRATDAISIIENAIFPLMSRLGVVFERPLSNESVHVELLSQMTYMEANVTTTLENARILSEIYTQAVQSIPPIQLYEAVRWPVTLTMLICFIVFCVVLFYAIVRHSRCCFITFSVLGLLSVIINWTLVSFYLVSAVAISDACVSPQRPLVAHMKTPPALSYYYLNCVDEYKFDEIIQGISSIEGAQHTLRVINSIAGNYYSINEVESHVDGLFRELYQIEEFFKELLTAAKCDEVKENVDKGLDAVCNLSLFGLTFLLISSLLSSLLFTLLVGFDSHTWIYIQKRKRRSAEECVLIPYSQSVNRQNRGGGYMPGQGVYDLNQATMGNTVPRQYNGQHPTLNNKYATLNKKCKTLEANDFY